MRWALVLVFVPAVLWAQQRMDSGDSAYVATLVGNTVYFDEARTVLDESSSYVLQQYGAWLASHENYDVVLDCHASVRGSDDVLWALAARRCAVVGDFLLSFGVERRRIVMRHWGDTRLVTRKKQELFNRANNRVQLTIQ